MLSYFFRHCLGFSLMMLDFVVVLTYLGAVASHFNCSQWERKGMIQMFISVFSAVWDRRTMFFIIL